MISVMAFEGGAFGKWSRHEDRALMNGISLLIKEESSLAPFCHVKYSKRMVMYQIRKHFLTRHWICWHIDPGLANLQNWEKNILLFISYPVFGISHSSPNSLDTYSPQETGLKKKTAKEVLYLWLSMSSLGYLTSINKKKK